MKNKFLLTASALALAFGFASVANAGCDGIYLAGRAGTMKPRINASLTGEKKLDDNSLMLSGALGYRYGYFRTELEYVWRDESSIKSNLAGYEFEVASYMWNVYWDLSPYTWFTPYFSAGIGVSKLEIHHTPFNRPTFTTSHEKFTWSLGGGLSAQVTNRLNLDVGYRFYDFGKFDRTNVKAHEIYGGVRYVF